MSYLDKFAESFMPVKFEAQANEIAAICDRLGITWEKLGELAAIKPNTMRKVFNGYQKASPHLMRSIHVTAKAEESRLDLKARKIIKYGADAMNDKADILRKIPVVSWAAAGKANDYEDLANQIEETVECDIRDPDAFALIVEGDSMEKEIMAGDRIVFSPGTEIRNNDIVVVRLKETGGVMVKRYRSKGPDNFQLESNRPEYPPLDFKRTAARYIYPAIEIQRRLRR